MSKEIKSAEEWNTLHTIVPRDVSSEDLWMIYDLAESYADYVLKAKLESITELRNEVLYLRNMEQLSVKGELKLLNKLNALVELK